MSLKDVDDQFLTRAADRLGAVVAWVTGKRRARERPERESRSGPLGVLRDVPQLGFLVVGAIFVAVAALVLSHSGRPDAGSPPTGAAEQAITPAETPLAALGPDIGASVPAYLASATKGLQDAGAGRADGSRVALVSLAGYRTPAQAVGLLKGIKVVRVYLRAPAAGVEAAQLPVDVTDLSRDLTRSYATTAKGRLQQQKEYQGYVDTIDGVTKDEKGQKALFAALATASGVEAKAYGSGCACVYAAVVQASVTQLLALRARAGVRAVQVAGKGVTLPSTRVIPLLPEVTTVVPKRRAVP